MVAEHYDQIVAIFWENSNYTPMGHPRADLTDLVDENFQKLK